MICERCGKMYIHAMAVKKFEAAVPGSYYDLSIDGDLCAECAIDYASDYIANYGGHPDDWVLDDDSWED